MTTIVSLPPDLLYTQDPSLETFSLGFLMSRLGLYSTSVK